MTRPRRPFRRRKVVEVLPKKERTYWQAPNRYRLDCGHLREVSFHLSVGLETNCYECGREAQP